jgi:hypothetical protein
MPMPDWMPHPSMNCSPQQVQRPWNFFLKPVTNSKCRIGLKVKTSASDLEQSQGYYFSSWQQTRRS